MRKEISIKKNASLNVIKQCTSAILPLITYPYISRTIGADNYGRVSFAESFISFFVLMSLLGIPMYAVREGSRIRDDHHKFKTFSDEMFTISFIAMIFSAFIISLCLLFIPRFHAESVLVAIFSIEIVASVLGRDWINSAYEDFAYISLRYIISHVVGAVLIFLMIKESGDLYIYAAILAMTFSAGLFLNILYTGRFVGYGFAGIRDIKKHIIPILALFSTTVAVKIYVSSDILVLGFFRSDSEVGIYSLSSKIYIIVKLLFNAVVATVIPRLSNYLGRGEMQLHRKTLLRLKDALYLFLIPAMAGLVMLSREIIALIGGEEFSSGYKCIILLSISLFFAVMANYYANAILVPLRKEKVFVIACAVAAIINVVLNILIIPIVGIEGAAYTTIIAEAIVMLTCYFAAKEYVQKSTIRYMMSILCGTLLVVVCCAVVRQIIPDLILRTVISMVCSVVLYVFVQLLFRNYFIMEFVDNKKK